MEPTETQAEKPTFSRKLQSSTAVSSAPLWLMKPTVPGRAMALAKVALRCVRGRITPRQFGPIRRILPRACSVMRRSSSTPAAPASLKPAEMMIAPFTPAATHSPTISGTVGAGVTMTARSTGSGTSPTLA
ncbi:MAG: hypothetical protein WC830_12290 [Burkholderiales bacterium]|jgi:hypothetical protein